VYGVAAVGCTCESKPVHSGGPAGRRSDDVWSGLGMLSVAILNVRMWEEVGRMCLADCRGLRETGAWLVRPRKGMAICNWKVGIGSPKNATVC
jgi:hypothetical protein